MNTISFRLLTTAMFRATGQLPNAIFSQTAMHDVEGLAAQTLSHAAELADGYSWNAKDMLHFLRADVDRAEAHLSRHRARPSELNPNSIEHFRASVAKLVATQEIYQSLFVAMFGLEYHNAHAVLYHNLRETTVLEWPALGLKLFTDQVEEAVPFLRLALAFHQEHRLYLSTKKLLDEQEEAQKKVANKTRK